MYYRNTAEDETDPRREQKSELRTTEVAHSRTTPAKNATAVILRENKFDVCNHPLLFAFNCGIDEHYLWHLLETDVGRSVLRQ